MCFRRYLLRLLSGAGRFAQDRGGSVLILFGISIPVIIIAIGMAIDLNRQVDLTSKAQKAADAAALASVTAMVLDGTNPNSAQTTGQSYFSANLPTGVTGSATVSASLSGSTATTIVTYSGSMPTSFGSLLHLINTFPIHVTSTAQGNVASGNGKQYAGNGSVAGDPHIAGADGSDGYLQCATPSGSWYNLLSDSGIEVNVSCVSYTGVWLDVIQSFSILLGSHVISLTAPSPTFDANGNASYDPATAWFGQITIDGVTYPATIGQQNYLGGQVWVTVNDVTNFYKSDNMVEIKTPTYTIFITFDAYAMGDINITATNAGKCGVPGGFWGGTLAGKDDYNGSDFLVSGPTATTSQFYRSTCTNAYAHLVQ